VRIETGANLWQTRSQMKSSWKEFIREDYKFFIIFIMLGAIMYWTAIVIEPTYQILRIQQERQELAGEQIKVIINNAEENTKEIKDNQDIGFKILNDTAKLSAQNRAQFEATLLHIDEQLDNQTDYLHNTISQNQLILNWILGNITGIDITSNITTIENQLDSISGNLSEIDQMIKDRYLLLTS
jgi:hypothetical protein